MDYQEIKDLINSTLHGKEVGHEITPYEHQLMISAVLDYAHEISVLGQNILNGFANPSTVPETPDDAKICYISFCPPGQTTTFSAFDDYQGNPISVTCTAIQVKFVVLLWNTSYWEKIEQSLSYE